MQGQELQKKSKRDAQVEAIFGSSDVDRILVYRDLTSAKNYGRSKRCKGAE